LAMVLALIRPGKRHLVGYEWPIVEADIWTNTDGEEGYVFKKAHAVSYAHVVVVQLNLLLEAALNESDTTDSSLQGTEATDIQS